GDFLAGGGPPLVFTPGTAAHDQRRFFAESAEACRRLGRRALLLTRFRGQLPARLPEGVRHADYLPFSRLLPHAAALVHHGGGGRGGAGGGGGGVGAGVGGGGARRRAGGRWAPPLTTRARAGRAPNLRAC